MLELNFSQFVDKQNRDRKSATDVYVMQAEDRVRSF